MEPPVGHEWPEHQLTDADTLEEANGYTRGRFPDDLEGSIRRRGLELLWRRMNSPRHEREITTKTLADVVRDLSRLELARAKPDVTPLDKAKQVNVLMLVDGLPPERRVEVLKRALDGAEDPKPIEMAIRELEAGNGVGEKLGAGGASPARA